MKPTVEKRTKNAIAYLLNHLKIENKVRTNQGMEDDTVNFDDIRDEYQKAKDSLMAVMNYFFS